MLLDLANIYRCEHEYLTMTDSVGGYSYKICIKCDASEQTINAIEEAFFDVSETIELADFLEKYKKEKDE